LLGLQRSLAKLHTVLIREVRSMESSSGSTSTPLLLRVPASLLPSAGKWPDDVAVWQIVVPDGAAGQTALTHGLAPAEQQRAGQYRQPADRDRFVTARHALRCLLGARLNVPPDGLRFAAGQYGKPHLSDHPQLSFNVTHSGARVLIAMSDVRHVGVDVESVDRTFDWTGPARLVCSKPELQWLQQMQPSLRLQAFLRVWTAKEALVKGVGTGIGDAMPDLTVDLSGADGGLPAAIASDSPLAAVCGFTYRWLSLQDGYTGCMAFERTGG
jgi:4'-phosphopantetheinyl transferase